jgi:hypothetical protein
LTPLNFTYYLLYPFITHCNLIDFGWTNPFSKAGFGETMADGFARSSFSLDCPMSRMRICGRGGICSFCSLSQLYCVLDFHKSPFSQYNGVITFLCLWFSLMIPNFYKTIQTQFMNASQIILKFVQN